MTQLIALVADAADVAAALAGGIRRVVIRIVSPEAADLVGLAAIGDAARDRCAVSLWCDVPVPSLAAALSASGADEVWDAPASEPPPEVARWLVGSPAGAPDDAAPSRAGLVIAGDASSRLLQQVTVARLAAQVRHARASGLEVRVGGSMEAPDVPRLQALGVEGLVGGDLLRTDGRVDPGKVRFAIDLLAQAGADRRSTAVTAPPGEPDRIFVRDWTVPLRVGAYGHETAPQRVRFNIEAEVARPAGRSADMRDVVTYDLITDAIARATVVHVALVETIAEDVAALVLAHPRVTAVDITVEKLDLGPGALGCRIRRRRAPP